jgi:hypothetical protein
MADEKIQNFKIATVGNTSLQKALVVTKLKLRLPEVMPIKGF